MANHIKYIDIHKFKGIKDINIYDMKSINIFVGDNNSGKTTILEAIKFFEKPFDYLSQLRLMSRKYNPRSIKYSKIKEIFNECKLENEININLESNGENYNLHIKGFEEEEIYFEDYELLGEDESNERTILEYTFNSEKREFILENRKKSRISLSKNNLKLINMGYAMPIDTYLEKSTLNAIDTVIKKGDKWKLIELLKIFDNSIIDINYTSDQEIYITTQDKIRNSKEYNTQIVATTHSREALEAILENLEHNLDDIALYRLENFRGKMYARRFSGQDAYEIIIEEGGDLR